MNILTSYGVKYLDKNHELYIYNIKKNKMIVLFIQIFIILFFLFLWELLVYFNLIDSFVFSSPSKIFVLMIDYLKTNELIIHTLVSSYEVLIGLFIGSFLGILIAILLFEIPILSKILDPYLIVLNALPKTALAPIIIIWVGANIKGIIVVTVSISLIITIINAHNAFKNVDQDKIKLLKTFNASRIQILRYLILPANINELINIIKINIGMSWIGVIVGEFIVSKRGLGYLITYGTQVFRLDLVMLGIITLAIVTMLMYGILNIVVKIYLKYRGW